MGMFTGLMNWLSARDYSRGALNKPPDIASDDRTLLAWQRTHMANERTFLSWSRTSISLLAFGFVIEKFELFIKHLMALTGVSESPSHVSDGFFLSLFCFALAGIMIIVSGLRFCIMRRHINSGAATFSILPDILVIVSVFIIIFVTIGLSFNRIRAFV